jgi:hypothetical protein
MAPCSGKPKCGCGCPKKKAVKRKAPAKKRAMPQRGSIVVPTYPGLIQQQFTPSFETPIPSAVSKVSGDNIVKKKTAEIGTQTDESYFDIPVKKEKKQKKAKTIEVKPETLEKLKEMMTKPMPVEKAKEPAKREMSRSGIAAIARSQSNRPIERVGNVVSFAAAVEEPKPAKVEDIKPRRGRPPGPRALGKNVLPGVQRSIEPSVSLAPQARQK